MIEIKILGTKYGLPTCQEISINRFIEFLTFADDNQPESLRDPNFEGERIYFDEAVYFAKELNFWTGCPLPDLHRHNIEELYSIWAIHQQHLYCAPQTDYNCFILDDEIYYLPEKFMSNTTIEDYAEANEYERNLADAANGIYEALPKIAAVICRKKGEKFGQYDVEERAQRFAKKLTAYDAFQVGFFLQRQSEKLATDFQIYSTSLTLAQLKQVYKN
jgi:hypothetical protein